MLNFFFAERVQLIIRCLESLKLFFFLFFCFLLSDIIHESLSLKLLLNTITIVELYFEYLNSLNSPQFSWSSLFLSTSHVESSLAFILNVEIRLRSEDSVSQTIQCLTIGPVKRSPPSSPNSK